MSDSVQGIKGEYREMTPKEIGSFVRCSRLINGIKRANLAHDAGVSEKTLERLENGTRVSDDVYRRVAAELGEHENAFLGPRYIRTPEESLRFLSDSFEKWNETYLEVEARQFVDERDMRRVLECRGALLFDDTQLKLDALDDAASFRQDLTDWKNIFDDVDEPDRLNGQRSLLTELRNIERRGYVARCGCYNAELAGWGKPIEIRVAAVTFFLRTDWKKVAMKAMAVPRRISQWTF